MKGLVQKKEIAGDQRRCVLCVNAAKNKSLMLADNSHIDEECLNIIYSTLSNNTADEDMSLFYQYIISMVMTCKKCNNRIDGVTRKQGNHCQPGNYFCHLCQPLKPMGKESQLCDICEKDIESKNRLPESFKIEGMSICNDCFNSQINGLSGKEEKEKEEKPDFGKLEEKPDLKYHSYNSLKKEEQEFKPMFGRKIFGMPSLKRQVEKHSQSSADLKSANSWNHLQKLVSSVKPPLPPPSVKKQRIKCSSCFKTYELHMFRLREEGYNICKQCYKSNHLILKKEEQKQDSYHLDLLFEETPDEVKAVEDIFQMLPSEEGVKVERRVEVVISTKESHHYDLKGCKICLNAQSSMINTNCRHLMMCDGCFRLLQSRNKGRGDNLPCPVCSTIGRYQKYIEPIYI